MHRALPIFVHRLLTLIGSGLCALHCVGCAAHTPSTHVMFAFDRTGSFAGVGVPGWNGAQLAMTQDAADGSPTIDATFVDTKSNPASAREAGSAARRAKTQAIAGFADNDQFLAMARTLGGSGIAMLSAGATDPRIPETIHTPIFMACFTDNVQAAAMIQFGMQKFGPRCTLIFDSESDYTLGLATYAQDSIVARGGVLVTQLAYSDSIGYANAVRTAASRANETDFILLAALPDRCGWRVRALRDAGVSLPILGGDSFDSPEILSADAPIDNVYYASHAWFGRGCTPRAEAFATAYMKQFGVAPTSFAGLGFDAAGLLIDAAARANGKSLSDALARTTHYEGVTGAISFENGPLPVKQVWIVGVQSGRTSLIDTFTPTVAQRR
ncbi:MAG: hypothetical protein EXS10_06120 [Phycisphaerales bacterium]|nr:hypothetical protein [Phycisphaerales bacterium]